MNRPEERFLQELAARRRLSGDEQQQVDAWLRAHPEQSRTWEEDQALNQWLNRLPDAPLSSNFTSQVMAIVTREQGRVVRRLGFDWLRVPWLRPVFSTGLALIVGAGAVAITFQQSRLQNRAELARSVAAVSTVTGLIGDSAVRAAAIGQPPAAPEERIFASLELLRDFDAIRRLNHGPAADVELLSALQ